MMRTIDDPRFLDWNYVRLQSSQPRSYTDSPSQRDIPIENAARNDADDNARLVPGTSEQSVSLGPVRSSLFQPAHLRRSPSNYYTPSRLLGPRYLCVLDDAQGRGYRTMRTEDIDTGSGTADYIFISYTRRQFCTQIAGDPSLPAETNLTLQAAAERDTRTLLTYAVEAAKAARVGAFWIDFECVRPEGSERADDSIEDVYRICDIVRTAHSLVIVTGPPLVRPDYTHDSCSTRAESLKDWGNRLWTVPEALLAPTEHRITICAVGAEQPESVAKRNLASRVWDDADSMRQLVDHYESSITLSTLEFISIALECLQRRQTEKRMSGDVAYALMGLLRQRPKVDKRDSAFQAFARLSLANDSNKVLERLICLKPTERDASWFDMHDRWNAALWEIQPLCEVIDISDNDTVVLGGARGSIINWSYLEPVDYTATSARPYAWIYARSYPTVAMWGLIMLIVVDMMLLVMTAAIERLDRSLQSIYFVFYLLVPIVMTCMGLLISLISPLLLMQLYGRNIHQTQARFFGIEGIPSLRVVEEIIFASDRKRISWKSSVDDDQPEDHDAAPNDVLADTENLRQFTLIDTLTLSAITFRARRPPNAVIACGQERGYVRSALCSYEADSATFCRENLVRMDSLVLERMPEMDRIRFTLGSRRTAI